MNSTELKEFLDFKYQSYNHLDFVADDPVLIPHQFTKKEDIEIAGFLAATIAWGQRKTIIKNASQLVEWMEHSPYEFVINATATDLKPFKNFVHRTFNGIDCVYFIKALQNIYKNHNGLETAFKLKASDTDVLPAIMHFRSLFFELEYPTRTTKHISSPAVNSSAKRLCMYLRWMVRRDAIDFGIWKKIKPHQLCMPLDIHTGNVSRKLGLLTRTQNDWKAVMELTENLRKLDPIDPIKYDISLFGLGVYGEL